MALFSFENLIILLDNKHVLWYSINCKTNERDVTYKSF